MSPRRALTRRDALAVLGAGAAGLLLGCGDDAVPSPGASTRLALGDPDGDGLLTVQGGVALVDRTDLGGAGAADRVLASVAQVTDVHVRDAQSPGRVAFLDRFGPRFGSAFRPHETLTLQVLAATVASVNEAGPDAVLVTGDLIDSAQRNELAWALAMLRGGTARPDSGDAGYAGVQAATIADPLYYRPDVDAPRHPGLLRAALRPVRSPGLRAPWYAALGNHDLLVQGELAPTPAITAVATGSELVVAPDDELLDLERSARLDREQIDTLLRAGLPGEKITVPADPARAHVTAEGLVDGLGGGGDRLDRAFAVGDDLWVVVLDLVRRDAGSGGIVTAATLEALVDGLDRAGDRRILVVCHQPLHDSAGAAPAVALLDADPRVVAVVSGHRHRNEITPRRTRAGGHWLVNTASIVDFPQQWRMLRVRAAPRGATVLETWMVDHGGRPGDPGDLPGLSRDLAFLDPQGGRPANAAGPVTARNVRLHLPPRSLRAPARQAVPAATVDPAAPQGFAAGDALGR